MGCDQHSQRDPQQQHASPEEQGSGQIAHPGRTREMDDEPDHGEDSYRGSGRLEAKRAVITGGDSGIGRAVAIAFAREGADVLISYLPEEEGDAQETAELVRKAGRTVVTVPGDIRSESHCQEVIDRAVRKLSGIDILVNNAAYQMAQPRGIVGLPDRAYPADVVRRGTATGGAELVTGFADLYCGIRVGVDRSPPTRVAAGQPRGAMIGSASSCGTCPTNSDLLAPRPEFVWRDGGYQVRHAVLGRCQKCARAAHTGAVITFGGSWHSSHRADPTGARHRVLRGQLGRLPA